MRLIMLTENDCLSRRQKMSTTYPSCHALQVERMLSLSNTYKQANQTTNPKTTYLYARFSIILTYFLGCMLLPTDTSCRQEPPTIATGPILPVSIMHMPYTL